MLSSRVLGAVSITLLSLSTASAARLQEPAAKDASAWDLAPPAPVEDGRVNELARWREVSCARCHVDQAREWASSRHALAWVNERYREELTDKKRPEGCYGCHIPGPLHAQDLPQKPAARPLASPADGPALALDEDPHFGVSCASCHVGAEGDILGPFGAPTDAHRSTKSDSFTPQGQSRLCIACHATSIGPVIGIAKDFAESGPTARGQSCVGCHMQSIERPIAREDGKPLPIARAGRSHALQTPRDPAFLRRAFRWRAEQQDGAVVLRIENCSGHRVPGLVDRRITITAELVDASGKAIATASTRIDNRSHLDADGRVEISLAGVGTRVRIRGLHEGPGFIAPMSFADEAIDVAR